MILVNLEVNMVTKRVCIIANLDKPTTNDDIAFSSPILGIRTFVVFVYLGVDIVKE